jgi:hypothetical protein
MLVNFFLWVHVMWPFLGPAIVIYIILYLLETD